VTHDQILALVKTTLMYCCHEASSLRGGRVYLVTGHSLCVGTIYVRFYSTSFLLVLSFL
jgi:hypothetical protein